MAGPSHSARRRGKAARKAGRHDAEGTSSSPGQDGQPPGTTLILAPQTLPATIPAAPAKRKFATGKLAAGAALFAATVIAFGSYWGQSKSPPAAPPTAPLAAVTQSAQAETAAPTPKVQGKAAAKADSRRKDSTASKHKNPPIQVAKAPKKAAPKPESDHRQDGMLLASKAPTVQNRYAQCLEVSGFLRREQCKWQACSGKWGQDGCPSYEKDEVNY